MTEIALAILNQVLYAVTVLAALSAICAAWATLKEAVWLRKWNAANDIDYNNGDSQETAAMKFARRNERVRRFFAEEKTAWWGR